MWRIKNRSHDSSGRVTTYRSRETHSLFDLSPGRPRVVPTIRHSHDFEVTLFSLYATVFLSPKVFVKEYNNRFTYNQDEGGFTTTGLTFNFCFFFVVVASETVG